jgi:hypothetical protein
MHTSGATRDFEDENGDEPPSSDYGAPKEKDAKTFSSFGGQLLDFGPCERQYIPAVSIH